MAATQRQKYLLADWKNELFSRVYGALLERDNAKKAVVTLPLQNPDGSSVLHRDNLEMLNIAELYRQEAMVYWGQLSREEQKELYEHFPNWMNT